MISSQKTNAVSKMLTAVLLIYPVCGLYASVNTSDAAIADKIKQISAGDLVAVGKESDSGAAA